MKRKSFVAQLFYSLQMLLCSFFFVRAICTWNRYPCSPSVTPHRIRGLWFFPFIKLRFIHHRRYTHSLEHRSTRISRISLCTWRCISAIVVWINCSGFIYRIYFSSHSVAATIFHSVYFSSVVHAHSLIPVDSSRCSGSWLARVCVSYVYYWYLI